jgi:phosphoribosylanthranilate isomerase
MIVQVYEIQDPAEAEQCMDLGVDHIGSVILSGIEWRRPAIKEVIHLSDGTETKNSLIPLFQDYETICRVLDYYRPHYVHFCDDLTDGVERAIALDPHILLQGNIKERFPEIGIIRSIPVPLPGAHGDFPSLVIAASLEEVSDFFLIDTWTGAEPVAGYIGITGQIPDWGLARRVVEKSRIPVILAGGLSPENVFDGLLQVMPAGADSCTGTNKSDQSGKPLRFQKDMGKVKKFVSEVKRALQAIRGRQAALINHLEEVREALRERIKALPRHSVRPHQLILIEELEEEAAALEQELLQIGGLQDR